MYQKIEKLAEWLDDQLPFKKWLGGFMGLAAEAVDGKVFAGIFGYAVSKVPAEYHPEINAALDAVLNKDYEALKDISTDRLVKILKTPLGDAREAIIVGAQVDMICKLIEAERVAAAQDDSVGGGGPGGDPDDGK